MLEEFTSYGFLRSQLLGLFCFAQAFLHSRSLDLLFGL